MQSACFPTASRRLSVLRSNAAVVRQIAGRGARAARGPQFGGNPLQLARKYALGPLEAVAFLRHGVTLL